MSEIVIVFAIIAVVVALFIWDRLPVVVVCLGCALALWASGVLTLNQAMAGFGDPATIFIAALFVVGGGLEATGVTAWAGQKLTEAAGDSRTRLIVAMMALVAALTALIGPTGAVAALMSVVVVLAVRLGREPAKLLLPLAFGAHAGSMLLLTGSPVNVLVSDTLLEAEGRSFGYFEFAALGVPLVLGTVAIAVFLGERLLPSRASANLPPDLTRHARTLVEQYRLSTDLHALRIRPGSDLDGASRAEFDLAEAPDLTLVSVYDADRAAVHRAALKAGDFLVVRGDVGDVGRFAIDHGLEVAAGEIEADRVVSTLLNSSSGLAEVLVPPRSPLVGRRCFPGMVSESGDMIILAIQRQGEDLPAGASLAAGDTMLLQGAWGALDRRLNPARVLVVNDPDAVRRQAVPLGRGAVPMFVILGAMAAVLALGLMPAAAAGLIATCAILLLKILSVEEMYRAINWTTVILIGALMPLSTAISQSGAAQLMADGLVATLGDAGPRALLAGLFVLTAVLGQVISNTATAFIIMPIAVVAAADMGVSAAPMLMGVCVAAAASFLTPIATPANLMVQEPAGYGFGDYWKLGIVMMAWFFLVAVFGAPLVWSF